MKRIKLERPSRRTARILLWPEDLDLVEAVQRKVGRDEARRVSVHEVVRQALRRACGPHLCDGA